MKDSKSGFNAQGSMVIIRVAQVGAVKIYVAAVGGRGGGSRAPRKKKDNRKLSLPPKLVKKLVWFPVISLCKIFIPNYAFDALLCSN